MKQLNQLIEQYEKTHQDYLSADNLYWNALADVYADDGLVRVRSDLAEAYSKTKVAQKMHERDTLKIKLEMIEYRIRYVVTHGEEQHEGAFSTEPVHIHKRKGDIHA